MARLGAGRRARRGGLAVEARLEEDGRRGDAGSAVVEAVLQGHRGGVVAGIALASRRHGYGSLGNGKEAEVGGMDATTGEEGSRRCAQTRGQRGQEEGRKKGMAAATAGNGEGDGCFILL